MSKKTKKLKGYKEQENQITKGLSGARKPNN